MREALARDLPAMGERIREGQALNQLGIISPDLVERRNSYEQALEFFRELNHQPGISMLINNPCLVYERLGLMKPPGSMANRS
jgi:hypothetical protein